MRRKTGQLCSSVRPLMLGAAGETHRGMETATSMHHMALRAWRCCTVRQSEHTEPEEDLLDGSKLVWFTCWEYDDTHYHTGLGTVNMRWCTHASDLWCDCGLPRWQWTYSIKAHLVDYKMPESPHLVTLNERSFNDSRTHLELQFGAIRTPRIAPKGNDNFGLLHLLSGS